MTVFSPRPDGTTHLPLRVAYLRPGRQTRETTAATPGATALTSGVAPGAARTGSTACHGPGGPTPRNEPRPPSLAGSGGRGTNKQGA